MISESKLAFRVLQVKMQTYPELYSNLFDCGVKTWKRQGIVGLYAGTVPSLAANILENASLFMFYGFCQTVVQVCNFICFN